MPAVWDHIANYEDFVEVVGGLTDSGGVAAVFDGVGATTFDGSLASLRPRGVLVIYGTASGPTPPLTSRLNTGGSKVRHPPPHGRELHLDLRGVAAPY